MRDAIVFSGWTWNAFNTPERIALALSIAGAQVLYCENPVSRFMRTGCLLRETLPGVHVSGTEFLGHRLNWIPGMVDFQCRMLATQVISLSESLNLRAPVFIYPHLGKLTSLCRQMKRCGYPLIHLCIDYPEPYQQEQIAIADRCLTIPPSVFSELRDRYGDKVSLVPQPYYQVENPANSGAPFASDLLDSIPHPRLAYIGAAGDRLDRLIIEALINEHPEWHFITFGGDRCVLHPSVHVLPWVSWQQVPSIVRSIDVGFMPYERTTQKNLQCVPLKLFDYFAAGVPVVSTPITYVQAMEDLVYVGDSAASLAVAIRQALAEPKESPVRERRKQIALAHSVENIAADLAQAAGLHD